MAASENLNTFSTRCGADLASPLLTLSGSGGRERSSLTRVLRASVRSRKGGTETEEDPLHIWAHELIKCHVEVPSKMA